MKQGTINYVLSLFNINMFILKSLLSPFFDIYVHSLLPLRNTCPKLKLFFLDNSFITIISITSLQHSIYTFLFCGSTPLFPSLYQRHHVLSLDLGTKQITQYRTRRPVSGRMPVAGRTKCVP